MNLKEELLKLRDKLTNQSVKRAKDEINLNDKVDKFIDWYFKNIVKGNYTDIGEYHKPNEMRNFIEKMAVWYELRYPDYEINRLMPGSSQEEKAINDVMFKHNNYLNEMLGADSDVQELEWAEFFNAHTFINSLPCDEGYLLQKPKYRNLLYIEIEGKIHLNLTPNGFVDEAENFDKYTNFKIRDKELKGKHLTEVIKLLNDNNIKIPINNELAKTVDKIEKLKYQKDEMLNCVMYRIIERGGNRMGPRRAFLFAKEFGRNIDIPMMYGIDYSDPGLRRFVNEYIKSGGSKNLMCYVGYFQRTNNNEKMDTVSIQDLIIRIHNNGVPKYTREENELHQRMVNAISTKIDHGVVNKEEVKQLRLQRKLEKRKK
jgi:hypothetical protein